MHTKPSEKWADWLVDAVATATQDRSFLRGDPGENAVVTEALYLNGRKAIELALGDWQPIKTAPKDGTWVLIWNGKYVTTVPAIAYFTGCVWMTVESMWADPTHWMLLPAPPAS